MIEAEEVDDRDHQLDDVEELEDDVDEEDRAPLRKYQKIVVVRADGGSETREVLAKPGIRTPQVLLTNESLRGNPRYVGRQGRMKPLRRANNPTESDTSFDDDLPPQLEQVADVDRRGVPSMQPLFRLYAESSLKHATNSLQTVLEDDDQLVMEEGDDPDAIVMADMPPIRRNQVVHEFDGWPLYWDRPIDFQEACDIMMSVKRVEESKICRDVPLNFRGEGTFVIDLRCFDNRHDVALDGLGMWGKPTGRTRFYAIGDTGKPVRVDDGKGKLPPDTPYEFKCMAKRYEHPQTENTGSRFLKKIFTAVHPPDRGTAVALAVVCYEWIGPPVDFVVREAAQPRRNPSSVPLDGSRSWEAASFAAAGYDAEQGVTLCNEVFDDCPLYAVGAIDFGHAACVILGGVDIDHSRVCCRVPQGFRQAGTFIVDIRNFVTDAELRRDGNGAWGKPAGHSRYYKLDGATGDAVRVDRGHKLIEGSDYDVQILSKRYEHTAVNGRFVRKIYTGRSRNGGRSVQSCCNLAVITYYWKGEPEYFEATPQRR
uniref:Uncharacterized protein n=1 Tax=Plectus sambesii TaxID=2011161 RepID=A0A914X6X9_9BILA